MSFFIEPFFIRQSLLVIYKGKQIKRTIVFVTVIANNLIFFRALFSRVSLYATFSSILYFGKFQIIKIHTTHTNMYYLLITHTYTHTYTHT